MACDTVTLSPRSLPWKPPRAARSFFSEARPGGYAVSRFSCGQEIPAEGTRGDPCPGSFWVKLSGGTRATFSSHAPTKRRGATALTAGCSDSEGRLAARMTPASKGHVCLCHLLQRCDGDSSGRKRSACQKSRKVSRSLWPKSHKSFKSSLVEMQNAIRKSKLVKGYWKCAGMK